MEKGQFVIINLRNMDYMKDKDGVICVYDTEEDASLTCGMYEFENAWVLELKYNHIEDTIINGNVGMSCQNPSERLHVTPNTPTKLDIYTNEK